MKSLFVILLLFICLTGHSQKATDSAQKPINMDSLFRAKAKESIGKAFPDFTALFNKQIISKDSVRGKVVFINFWFENCPPCITELSALNELYKKFSPDNNFEFLSFTYESPERILFLKKKYHIPYKVASVSTQECYRLNQNNGFPTSIVLNGNGVIRDLFTGGDTDKHKAEMFIRTAVYESIANALKNQ